MVPPAKYKVPRTNFAVDVGEYDLLDSFDELVYFDVHVDPSVDSSILNLPAYADGAPVPWMRVEEKVTDVGLSVPEVVFTMLEGVTARS